MRVQHVKISGDEQKLLTDSLGKAVVWGSLVNWEPDFLEAINVQDVAANVAVSIVVGEDRHHLQVVALIRMQQRTECLTD